MEQYKSNYCMMVHRKERVTPVVPLQVHYLPLSNLDLLLPPFRGGVFLCYNPTVSDSSVASKVSTLKASLAEVLVAYYPFAGEMVTNSTGEPEVHCNNRGVDFVEAYADVELGELRFCEPDEIVGEKLMPKEKDGLLCIQATELKCGGLVVACSFDHRIADGYSYTMFLVAWAATSSRSAIPLRPSFRRSLLAPRCPCPSRFDPSLNRDYTPCSSVPPPSPTVDAVSRIYHIDGDDIDRMQAEASSGAHRRTKLEAFSAYLWRAIAKASGADAKVCRLCVVVDGRPMLQQAEPTSPMADYFGNVISFPCVALPVAELACMALNEAADAVHGVVQGAATAEHFRGLVDCIERHRPEAMVGRIFCKGGEEESGPAVMVSSGRRFQVSQVDFGWGRPAVGSYYFPWELKSGYVMPMPSAAGDGDGGDWMVYVRFSRGLLERLEAEGGDVFRRLSPEHFRDAVRTKRHAQQLDGSKNRSRPDTAAGQYIRSAL